MFALRVNFLTIKGNATVGPDRDLEGLVRATAAMRPYFGENAQGGKFLHLLIQLNKALDVQVRSAEEVPAVISQVSHRDF
jgi:hypothetical protein